MFVVISRICEYNQTKALKELSLWSTEEKAERQVELGGYARYSCN